MAKSEPGFTFSLNRKFDSMLIGVCDDGAVYHLLGLETRTAFGWTGDSINGAPDSFVVFRLHASFDLLLP